jgi:putative aminopeptidase FrvX
VRHFFVERPTPVNPRQMLADLVALTGPPGAEGPVRDYVAARVAELGMHSTVDAKGNLLISSGPGLPARPQVVVTAHLDEIALLVTGIEPDGALLVSPLGGAFVWKWGEGPVEILARGGAAIPGVLSLGSIHTTSPYSAAHQAREGAALTWRAARIVTGLTPEALAAAGVRTGCRAVIARSRRSVFELGGDLVSAYFLDDRADLVALLLALEAVRGLAEFENVLWAATVSEEVGGEGALFLLQERRPDICVALEIGPITPDASFALDSTPTVWVSDTYASMDPRDLDLIEDAGGDIGLSPHFHAVTRGGSDASCAASHGLCARPVTLAFAAENSHGFEIMHRDAPEALARLLVAYLRRLRL